VLNWIGIEFDLLFGHRNRAHPGFKGGRGQVNEGVEGMARVYIDHALRCNGERLL